MTKLAALFLTAIAAPAMTRLPLRFEENVGQAPADLRFIAAGSGSRLALSADGAQLMVSGSVVRMRFAGARRNLRLTGLDELSGKSNFLIGKDPRGWHKGVRNYARVRYEQVYPGIDVIFYGTGAQEIEYDFVLAPGADPTVIEMEWTGVERLSLGRDGAVRIGTLRLRKPAIYQQVNGTRAPVAGRYVKRGNYIGFALAAYDARRPLVIDPVLSYSSYLGGTGGSAGESITLDKDGCIYLTGTTTSNNFPKANAVQPYFYGSNDIFITKLDPTGRELIYSTYLGGLGDAHEQGIAVDATGAA